MANLYTLKNDWYAPDGSYYPASRVQPYDIPDHLVKYLPKNSAEVYDPAKAPKGIIPPMMNLDTKGAGRVTTQEIFAKQEAAAPKPVVKEAEEVILPPGAAVEQANAEQGAEAIQAGQAQETVPVVTPKVVEAPAVVKPGSKNRRA